MSTRANPRKDRCRTAKSLPRVESWAVLSLKLRVRVILGRVDGSESAGGHPTGNPEVQIRRSGGGALGQDARRREPLGARVRGRSEHEFGTVLEVDDDPLAVERHRARAPQQRL